MISSPAISAAEPAPLVASVDYRMGPEHKFPAAVDDSFAALEWVHANAESLGADPGRIGVHGDSAGANLAAVVALLARDAGSPSCGCNRSSTRSPITTWSATAIDKYANGYGILTKDAMVWFRDHYLRDAGGRERLARLTDQGRQPRRGRARRSSSPRSATCCTMTASAMPRRCAAPACRSSTGNTPGMIHAFFGMVPAVDDAMNAQRTVWAAFKRAFA